MSMSRWEATTQWTGRRWKSLKEWTREKSQSRPVRWGVSILSGASLASAMHGFIPTEGAWLAFNILATGVTFVVSARITSHGLSTQDEAPEKTKALVQTTAKEYLQVVIDQLNENVKRENNNTALILEQLTDVVRKTDQVLLRFRKPTHHTALTESTNPRAPIADIESGLSLSQANLVEIASFHEQKDSDTDSTEDQSEFFDFQDRIKDDIAPLQPIRLRIPTNDAAAVAASESPSFDCSYLTHCWDRIRGPRRLNFFSRTESTELTQALPRIQTAQDRGIVYSYVDLPSPRSPQILVETYQTDLEAGITRQFY
jgi:hypothetical protein